jgi:hypothetical protein
MIEQGLKILKQIQTDYPDAFIAGGFLRDLNIGLVQPKDLDIFTFCDPKGDEKDEGVEFEPFYNVQRVVFVGRRDIEGFDLPVQLIFLDKKLAHTPAAAVAQFALGIQQVWHTGDKWGWHHVFEEDRTFKRFTVTNCKDVDEGVAIMYKISSLQLRYPGWEAVIPDEFKPLIPGAVHILDWPEPEEKF